VFFPLHGKNGENQAGMERVVLHKHSHLFCCNTIDEKIKFVALPTHPIKKPFFIITDITMR
jgi:hypothetical protein